MNLGELVSYLEIRFAPYGYLPAGWTQLLDDVEDLQSFAAMTSGPYGPTGTTSATSVMMGLGAAITPVGENGRIEITIDGELANTNAFCFAVVQMRTGTGTAPTNGAAATGTTRGPEVATQVGFASQRIPFSLTRIVTGLTPNTAIWIDVGLRQGSGGTASVLDGTVCAREF